MTPTIALAYIHPGTVRAEFMDSVCRVITDPRYRIVRGSLRSSADITRARNKLFGWAAGSGPNHVWGADYLWWLDADVVFEPDVLERLIAADRPIVSALYYGVHDIGGTFPVGSIFEDGKLRRLEHTDIHDYGPKAEAPIEVAGTGMGCCLISRDVLDVMHSGRDLWPYAEMIWPEYGPIEDDITFCLRAKAMGFPTVIDTATIVGHVKDRVIRG